MRILLVITLLPFCALAQPADWMERHRNPCGFAPNDTLDLNADGIGDLVVQGISNGTDDEPSSSGHCALYVMNLPGTTLLNGRDAQGHWRTKVCTEGNRIPALDTLPQDDLRIPQEMYADGSLQVAQWGYGHQAAAMTITPGLAARRYVFQVMSNGELWHGSFAIEPAVQRDNVVVNVGALMPSDQAFEVR